MSGDIKIIVPGTDHPGTIGKVLEMFAGQQRLCTLIVRRGERFVLKIIEVRKEMSVQPLEWVETNRTLPWQHIIMFRKKP